MADKKNRGKRPTPAKGELRPPTEPTDFNDENPKFCLRYLADGFDVHALSKDQQVAFAKALQKLARSTWKELVLAPRHGRGSELITASQIKPAIPVRFQDTPKFHVFRYDGLLPMAGARVRDVYHVLWIEPEFGRLYDHG